MMNEHGKSDIPVVPANSRTKLGATGGGGDGGKRSDQREPATAKRVPDTEPDRTRPVRRSGYVKQQSKDKETRFTALLHHIYSLETLRSAYFDFRRKPRPVWMVRRGGTTARLWRRFSKISPIG